MWARYLEALKNRPIRTNMATAFCINFVGDMIAQNIEFDDEALSLTNIKWERTGTVASFGTITAGPAYLWFKWLDRQFPLPQATSQKFSRQGLWMLAKKLTVHMGIFAPTMNACFYGWLILKDHVKEQQLQQQYTMNAFQNYFLQQPGRMTTLQYAASTTTQQSTSRSITFWQQWYAKLEKDLLETQINSLKVWGTAQTFNFLVLPPHTRVLFTNFVAAGWVAYLSIVGHREHHDDNHHPNLSPSEDAKSTMQQPKNGANKQRIEL